MKQVSWLEVTGNPFLTQPSPRMLLDDGYTITKTTKLRSALKGLKSPKQAYEVLYDKAYVRRWIEANLCLFHLSEADVDSIMSIIEYKIKVVEEESVNEES